MADRDVELNLTARDEASDVVDSLADSVEALPDEATVDVEADVKEALSRIDAFDRQVEDLTDDGRELRITFRGEQLQREIRGALRDLERLEDPAEIEVRTRDLERAQKELRDLAELADKKYSVDIDADPRRTAQRAAGDIDSMRQRGEGLQSALPAIRGFGDELGGTAAGAGIASQAVADLGDFALISGERFAKEGSRMAGVATKLGTVLGAAGLAGAIAGIGVQVGQIALPALIRWINGTDDAIEANEELRGSFESVGDALAAGDYRKAVDTFLSSNDELVSSARNVGVSSEDLARYVLGLQTELSNTAGLDKTSEAYRQLEADSALARSQVQRETADRINFTKTAVDLGDELLRKRVDQLTAEGRYTEALELAATAQEQNADATSGATDAAGEQAAAADAAATAIKNHADAALDAAGANRSLADANIRVLEESDAWAATLASTTEELGKTTAGTAEYRAIQLEAVDGATSLADAMVGQAKSAAEAAGTTLAASEGTSIWNASMLDAARAADGPLRDSIVNYIATVNGIPPEVVSDILADTQYETVEEANRALDTTSETRKAQINAEAATGQANRDLDATANKKRTATIGVRLRQDGTFRLPNGVIVQSLPPGDAPGLGDPIPTPFGQMSGDSAVRYAASNAGQVTDVTPTRAGDTFNVTVNLPRAAAGRDVQRALSRWARINGR